MAHNSPLSLITTIPNHVAHLIGTLNYLPFSPRYHSLSFLRGFVPTIPWFLLLLICVLISEYFPVHIRGLTASEFLVYNICKCYNTGKKGEDKDIGKKTVAVNWGLLTLGDGHMGVHYSVFFCVCFKSFTIIIFWKKNNDARVRFLELLIHKSWYGVQEL